MISGVHGRLLTASFIRDVLPALRGVSAPPTDWSRRVATCCRQIESALGAASSVRAITEIATLPLLELLGMNVRRRAEMNGVTCLDLSAGRHAGPTTITTAWGEPLDRAWRSSVLTTIRSDVRWCLCCNGQALRIVDGRRTWSRDYLEFDLALLGEEPEAQSVLWAIAHVDAFAQQPPLLDAAVDLSRDHGAQVCRALGAGVLEALQVLLGALTRGRTQSTSVLWEQSLTVLYRVLFLLFAEARGLMPLWHPVYRDRYSLEAIVTSLLERRAYRGLWRAIQAISRLAHNGCTTGELRVTAFNGRLFAPANSAAFDHARLSDAVMERTVVALSTTPTNRHGRRTKILYRDLDVEQLGAVYERVLDYEPASEGPATLVRTRDVRKSSGSFYTPRAVTTFLVRRTLEPLVRDRSAEDILALRVLDPAMGSGAFLVAACRYLASAAEDALIQEGRWHAHDVTTADRVALRREIASRCLFGVDRNPMAVQLARLSIWLATLAADKPLSFLDHHLVVGHSLVGATLEDIRRQPGGTSGRRRHQRTPLFDESDLPSTLAEAAALMSTVSRQADDSAEIVRAKEQTIRRLHTSSLAKWKAAFDLWCGSWFWEGDARPDRAVLFDLMSGSLARESSLPAHLASGFLDRSIAIAARYRFLHWPLTFPDVFSSTPGETGRPVGFDAVVGNPPWDMVRGDSGGAETRGERRLDARHLADFVRQSGIYTVESRAHANLYQLFIERALQLVRPGGRIGFVVPSGLASDAGAAPLRRHLLHYAEVDEITGLDNRLRIFPVHRSVRFVLFTCTTGRETTAIRCRFGLTRADDLDAPHHAPLVLSRRLLARVSGEDDLGIPELANEQDLTILEAISNSSPRLGAKQGWNVAFGRELNATDDRELFVPVTSGSSNRPVIEGKQVAPYRVAAGDSRLEVRPAAEANLRVPRRARLAYRDVASATNRLTLIAAIVPARAVTTHTLFCLRTPLQLPHQRVLCALLNSYVANYIIRLRVNTHVTVSLVTRLPVPVVQEAHPFFARLEACVVALTEGNGPAEEMEEYAEAQAIVAHLYNLTAAQFEHVLATFPLVPSGIRQRALQRFTTVR